MGTVATIPRQPQLEGMKEEVDQELTDLAIQYETERNKRQAAAIIEGQRKGALELKMNEKGVAHYRDHEAGIEAFFETTKNLKVKRIKQEPDDDGKKD